MNQNCFMDIMLLKNILQYNKSVNFNDILIVLWSNVYFFLDKILNIFSNLKNN